MTPSRKLRSVLSCLLLGKTDRVRSDSDRTPGGALQPVVSAINYAASQTRANNLVLGSGAGGDLLLKCTQPTGYFEWLGTGARLDITPSASG
ncbi:MAG TPA: hypothetical protein VK780_07455 [Thermoanaerobaculia bacterium]|nr:hypothetical protein [Thermoanaerobaculia bacterium]